MEWKRFSNYIYYVQYFLKNINFAIFKQKKKFYFSSFILWPHKYYIQKVGWVMFEYFIQYINVKILIKY